MFKRANKITALLVAAASVMSVVPAMADTTSSRLGTKDGTIENAIAYKDGKYVYQGYKSDNDTDAVYYNDGSKDKSLDDLSSSNLNVTYADKYAFANDGSTQYLVDLTSGSVTDSTTPTDDIDTAATKLQTKLNKADRYKNGANVTETSSNLENGQTGDVNSSVFAIPGNKFGDTWYAYSANATGSDASKYVDKLGNLYGFTDGSGKYIDASYTANIYAYSTYEGKTVKIDNFSNDLGDVDSDSQLLATLVKQPVALAQDNDYIYALTTVAITDMNAFAQVTGGTTAAAATVKGTATASGSGAAATTANGVTTVRTYIQKISKAQGDQKDGGYLPKTVESYEAGNFSGNELDCGDAHDAAHAILDTINQATGASLSDLTQVTQGDVTLRASSNGLAKSLFTINNGNLVAVELGGNGTTGGSSSKVDAFTLKFKKDKVKFLTFPGYKGAASTTSTSTGLDKNTKFDAYLLEKDSDSSIDLSSNSNVKGVESYDIDVNGNVWMIAEGKIYEYKNGSMTQVYTCDSSLDAISVYDANNIVAWEDNGNIYTTVNEGTAQTQADAPQTTAPAVTVKTGWDQLTDGSWNFYDATGAKVANKWVNAGGVWYFLKADGVMATGWYNDNGTWYFLKSSGAMATGWVQDGGAWYYLNASGAMLANTTTPDGYFVGSNGAWVQ